VLILQIKVIIETEKEEKKINLKDLEKHLSEPIQIIKAEAEELPSGVGVFLPKFEKNPHTIKERCDFLKEISNKLAETFDEMGLFSDEIETIFKFLKVEFEFKEEKY
jgi:hypothetical protein